MPHGFIKDFKSNLGAYAAIILGKLQALAIQKVQKVILEVLEKLKEACPPPEELERLTNKINAVKQVINGIEQKINKVRPLPNYLDPIILGAKIIIDILNHDPLPGTIGTPPGPAGGVIFSEPKGMSAGRAAKLKRFQNFVEALEDDQKAIRDMLNITQGVFVPILTALNLIEGLIASCATNQSLSDEERRNLIKNIQGTTDQAFTEGILYTSKNVNGLPYLDSTGTARNLPGFRNNRSATELSTGNTDLLNPNSFAQSSGVSNNYGLGLGQPGTLLQDIFSYPEGEGDARTQTEGRYVNLTTRGLLTGNSRTTGDRPSGNTYLIKLITVPDSFELAPRRQAIVTDYRGVVVLRGPKSFASSPQVLIDEMKFIIDNQLP